MTTESMTAPCKPKLKQPPLYKVIFFNDDISTFQCVMDILVNYFNKSEDAAYELAFKVHIEGSATAGIYPKDIAESKISLANSELKSNGFPLHIELTKSI